LFEVMTTFRLPWVEVNFGIDWYPKFLQAAKGMEISEKEIFDLGDRIYALIKAYWVREKGGWSREMDTPPSRWFKDPLSQGDLKGSTLERARYDEMLFQYYALRGWDENGIPKRKTLEQLGLEEVAATLWKNG